MPVTPQVSRLAMAAGATAPAPPEDFGTAGGALWQQLGGYAVLDGHRHRCLLDACRLADTIDELEATVADDGPTVIGSMGQPRQHPALAEIRQARVALADLTRRVTR